MTFISPEIKILLTLLTAFVITYVSIPSIIKVANIKNLHDEPDERTVHSHRIPTLGGLAIFAGITISSLIFVDISLMPELKLIIAAVLVLFFIGIKDDILIIAPLTKLIGQIIAVLIIISFSDLRITNFHGFFDIFEIPDIVSYPFTVFVFLVVINGINLIDGIDGLSSGVTIIIVTTLGTWFFLTKNYEYVILSVAILGSLLAFLRFNLFSKLQKIFMGDTGSLILGLLISVLVVKFNELNINHDFDYSMWGAPAISFAILILPLFDTIRIIFIRFFQRKPLFRPDKQHIHHLFIKSGLSHTQSLLLLLFINVVFAISGFYLHYIMGIRLLLLLYILSAMLIFYIPAAIIHKRKKNNKK